MDSRQTSRSMSRLVSVLFFVIMASFFFSSISHSSQSNEAEIETSSSSVDVTADKSDQLASHEHSHEKNEGNCFISSCHFFTLNMLDSEISFYHFNVTFSEHVMLTKLIKIDLEKKPPRVS